MVLFALRGGAAIDGRRYVCCGRRFGTHSMPEHCPTLTSWDNEHDERCCRTYLQRNSPSVAASKEILYGPFRDAIGSEGAGSVWRLVRDDQTTAETRSAPPRTLSSINEMHMSINNETKRAHTVFITREPKTDFREPSTMGTVVAATTTIHCCRIVVVKLYASCAKGVDSSWVAGLRS